MAPDAGPDDVRRAYRSLLLRHHPDHGGDPRRTAELVEAFRALHAPLPPAPPDPSSGRDGTLLVQAPADEAFIVVLEAAHAIGPVTYVDRESGLLEVVVDGCSLFLSLQGRANGTTEVFATLEALGGPDAPCPPIDDVLGRLASAP